MAFLEDIDAKQKKKPRGVSTNDDDFINRMNERISVENFQVTRVFIAKTHNSNHRS